MKTRFMRIFILTLISIITLSCGSTIVDYDYEKNVDFSDYTTYQFDLKEPTGLSEFDERRMVNSIDSILQQRGYVRTEKCDFYITLSADEYESQSRNTIGVGIGGGGGNVGVGVSGGIPIGGRELHQVITTTFYKADEGYPTFWEATSESDLKVNAKPEARDVHYTKLATKILSKYPPKK